MVIDRVNKIRFAIKALNEIPVKISRFWFLGNGELIEVSKDSSKKIKLRARNILKNIQ